MLYRKSKNGITLHCLQNVQHLPPSFCFSSSPNFPKKQWVWPCLNFLTSIQLTEIWLTVSNSALQGGARRVPKPSKWSEVGHWVAKAGTGEPRGWAWKEAEVQTLGKAEFRAIRIRQKEEKQIRMRWGWDCSLGERPVSGQAATLSLIPSSLDFSLIDMELFKLLIYLKWVLVVGVFQGFGPFSLNCWSYTVVAALPNPWMSVEPVMVSPLLFLVLLICLLFLDPSG